MALGTAWLCLMSLMFLSGARSATAGWQLFNTTDGLTTNSPRQFLEDSSGTYWVIYGGASRYDGARWSHYVFPDSLNDHIDYAADDNVQTMFQDRSGTLWFGHVNYLRHFDGTHWSSIDCGGTISSIAEDSAGNIWVGTESGVRRFNGANVTTYDAGSGLVANAVSDIAGDHSGNVWVATHDGVSRFDGTSWTTFVQSSNGLASNYVFQLAVDHWNNLWFATDQGLTRFDGSTWRTFRAVDGLASPSVSSVAEDRYGTIWAGCAPGGVSAFDGQRWRSYGLADGVPQGFVFDIDSDPLGNMWFCIDGSGLARFDGVESQNYSTSNLTSVQCGLEDHTGSVWFGTQRTGLNSFDGTTWTYNGLAGYDIRGIAESSDGTLWVATQSGMWVRSGSVWRLMTVADGLPSNELLAVAADDSGNIWFSFPAGVTRFDRNTFTTFGNDIIGIPRDQVLAITKDRSGDMLFGTSYGLRRYHAGGFTWAGNTDIILGVLADSSGDIWCAEQGAGIASHFDGTNWTYFKEPANNFSYEGTGIARGEDGATWVSIFGDGIAMIKGSDWRTFTGLGNGYATSILVDRAGAVWVGTNEGVTRYKPDHVAPRTVITGRPGALTTSKDVVVSFVAAFGETRGVQFSTRFDGQSWSEWGTASAWSASALPDGPHKLEVRSRDYSLNVEAAPVAVSFEIDGTPPKPILTAPAFGQVVRGVLSFIGFAADPRQLRYSVAVRPIGVTSWIAPEVTTLAISSTPVVNGTLASWDTSHAPDGAYEALVSETDSLGLVGTDLVAIIVDNHAPFADVTAPSKVTATAGGDVYTTNAETHLYFPPHAFAQDAVVMVTAAGAGTVPSTLPSGGVKVLDGYELTWAGTLKKPARFTLSYADAALPAGTLALYRSADGTDWERLGGTVDGSAKSLSLAVSLPGHYALFADNGLAVGGAALSGVAFTPRVFSPTGGFADREVGISFRLGKPAPVTVKVFSRSGRLIREVVTGQAFGAGDNLVRWDGTDRNGGTVTDGLYLVTIEALGHTETKTLAVVK